MATTTSLNKIDLHKAFYNFALPVSNIFGWFKYVKIKDATTQSIVDFEMWNHLKLLIYSIIYYKLVVLLKTKQIGCSWTAAAFHLWLCYHDATNVLCLSKGEDDAAELLDKSRFINSRLPNNLQLKVGHDGHTMMTFPDTNSKIIALPSTEDAGAGWTGTHVTRDELDMHKYADENYGNIKPTIDAGASELAMSTSKRIKANSHFKQVYNLARKGKSNYKSLFFPFHVRPGRDWSWYLEKEKDYPVKYLFEQAYPITEEDALSGVAGIGLFDRERLEELLEAVMLPKRQPNENTYIYHPYNSKYQYYAGGDAAEGRGGDYSCIWIEGTDGMRRWLAAILHSNNMPPDMFGLRAYNLLCDYARPYLVMDNDTWGIMVMDNLDKAGYRDHIYSTDEKGDKLGYGDFRKNRDKDLENFAKSVRDGLIIEHEPAVDEMFGWSIDKGKYVSDQPHDDMVSAAAKANIAHELALIGGTVVERDSYF